MEAELCDEAFTIRETEEREKERQEEQPAAENQVLLRDIKEDEDTSAAYPESKTADSLYKTPNETDENFRPAMKQEPADELNTTETTDNTVIADITFEGGKRGPAADAPESPCRGETVQLHNLQQNVHEARQLREARVVPQWAETPQLSAVRQNLHCAEEPQTTSRYSPAGEIAPSCCSCKS